MSCIPSLPFSTMTLAPGTTAHTSVCKDMQHEDPISGAQALPAVCPALSSLGLSGILGRNGFLLLPVGTGMHGEPSLGEDPLLLDPNLLLCLRGKAGLCHWQS